MEIKDFTPGQTAYALMTRRGKTTEHFVMRYTVTKVGRKYVSSTKTPGGKGYFGEEKRQSGGKRQ